jgi:glycosyltransferase involved in cell wall biosynthesis
MRIGRFGFALLNPLIDQLVGISNQCAKALSAHTGRKLSVIFNGVSFNRFSQQELKLREIGQKIDCIAVGRICEEKNYELLIRTIASLPNGIRSNMSVQIAGDGPELLAAKLEKKILDYGLGDVIRLLGNRSDIPALLASSQLFLMSSSSEGLPIALIEASVAGLPCVVTDAGGCSEIVDLCRNGVVVEPANPQALASAIEKIISDPVQFTKFSANALENSKVFSIVATSESHITLYECLLSSQDHKQAGTFD